MNQRPSQRPTTRGFSPIETVMVLVVILIIGAGSWYVWAKSKAHVPVRHSSSSQSNTTQSTKSDPTDGGKYLAIKEWGVRFPLPEELRGDVTYGVITSSSTDQQSAHLAIGKIDRLSESNCELRETTTPGELGKGGGVVDVQRRSTPYDAEAAKHYEAEVHIDGYWYYITSMRDACFNAPDNEFANLIKEIESLAEAVKDLKPINQ